MGGQMLDLPTVPLRPPFGQDPSMAIPRMALVAQKTDSLLLDQALADEGIELRFEGRMALQMALEGPEAICMRYRLSP